MRLLSNDPPPLVGPDRTDELSRDALQQDMSKMRCHHFEQVEGKARACLLSVVSHFLAA